MNTLYTMNQNTMFNLCIIQLLITVCLSIMKHMCIMSQPITSLPTMKFLFIMRSLFTTMFLFIIVLLFIMKSLSTMTHILIIVLPSIMNSPSTMTHILIIVLPFIMKSLITMTHMIIMLFLHTTKKRLITL